MDFIERLELLSKKVENLKDTIETEEATKNAFIMPFIASVLGYDVFDPTEVVPEFTADTGVKKGEKVDYAIMKDGEVQILIECKKCSEKLNDNHKSQLSRYFHVTNARIAILTNGIEFQFFTDLDAQNKMDNKPFLELDMLDIKEDLANELKKLTKGTFDIEAVVSTAGDLKYTIQIKKVITNIFNEPDEEFTKMIAGRVYEGTRTQKVIEQFIPLTKKALKDFLYDYVRDRFEGVMDNNGTEKRGDVIISAESEDDTITVISKEDRIETTEEELEGFHIIKSLLRKDISSDRIVHRDTISYFGILLDDNNRKPICRLHFNSAQKYIGIFDENKKEERHPIETLEEIYDFAPTLVETAKRYDG